MWRMRWSTSTPGCRPSATWCCRRRPPASSPPPSSASSSPGTNTPSRCCSPRDRRRPLRPSFPSSSEEAARTGRRVPQRRRCSWFPSWCSPCCCAKIFCGESPSERCANEDGGAATREPVAPLAAPRADGDRRHGGHRGRRAHAAPTLLHGAVHLLVRHHPGGACAVHRRVEVPGVTSMAEIRVENLHKAFAEFVAVRDSSFTVPDGDFFCLLGPSGCGKTTTLRMIAGLELPTSGRILLGEEDVTFKQASQRDIAFVFQLFALYPHMNVRSNIAFPLRSQGMLRSETATRVREAARILRIEHLLDRPVAGLSSGDRQRVALGRAIVREPMAFLLDEPLGALDAEFREVMCGELRALPDRLHATTVYVTRDQFEAMSRAD